MEIIPSIDILDGRVVQLVRGDYGAARESQITPMQAAQRWISCGARRLHVVDLDGARSGHRIGEGDLSALVRQVSVPIQASGGIRSCETARLLISIGIDRVIFVTEAATNPETIRDAIQEFGTDHVVVGVNAKSGLVATDGLTQTTRITAVELISRMMEIGASRFMYRDVDREGTLEGPGLNTLTELNRITGGRLTIAGGIGDLSHLRALASIDIESVVLGTSIYTGAIDYGSAAAEFHETG